MQEAGIDTAPLSPSETSLPLAVAQIISTARQALASGVSASARACRQCSASYRAVDGVGERSALPFRARTHLRTMNAH